MLQEGLHEGGGALPLLGRVVLVTGAAAGIGRATVLAAARAGARVHGWDRDAGALADTFADLDADHSWSVVDLRDVDALPGHVEDLWLRTGGLDAVVHAAGVIRRVHDVDAVTEQDWDEQVDVNLKAAFFLLRAVAARMRATGRAGSLVTFASQGWWTGGFGGSVVYSASKGGIVSLTRGLARTWASQGVRVNCVAPGFIDTGMMAGLDEDTLTSLLGQVPMGRLGDPGEVADVAVFLASPASRYMTGTTLSVSGGQLMY